MVRTLTAAQHFWRWVRSAREGVTIASYGEASEAATGRKLWLGIEVRHLAALSVVAREHSFRAAARDLGYAQSAISQQIAALERLVGVRLIDRTRGRRSVALTAAGQLLLEHATEILGQ